MRRLLPLALALLCLFAPALLRAQRQMESLGRGLLVLRSSGTQVYVGWRLLGNDPSDLAFNLYRSANGGAPVKLNAAPLTATTDYLDAPAGLSTTAYAYSVRPVLNGIEVPDTWANPAAPVSVTLPANAPVRQYLPVALRPAGDTTVNTSHDVKFCWVGDFDGDGEYDFVLDRTNTAASTPQWLQAYKRDGTLLWQMNMGPNSLDHYNITPGSSTVSIGHGDNVTVYDLDGDGRAEVVVRTARGVVFPDGSALVAPDNETQYISILDGLTGAEKARAKINLPASWPTKTRVNGQMGVVYADGLRPSLFFHASNRNPDESFNHAAYTWDFRGGVLSQRWVWPFSGHTAEGHQIRLADVDNDGRDEYVDIGHVLKADGSGQLNGHILTEVVHGDRFHVTDIDPDRPGLETFLIQQNNPTYLATAYHSADKSSVIRKWYTSSIADVGRGTVGAFYPNLSGLQFFSTVGGTYDARGDEIHPDSPFPPETIWWDADLGREFLSTIGSSATSPGIDKFNTASPGSTSRLLSIYSDPQAPNSPYNNYIASGGRPQFWGDLLGDWREELICVASDNSEFRIYATKTPDAAKTGGGQAFRIYTPMHNPQYRIQATTKGYVQSGYTDYYLGYGMPPPPPPPMVDARLVWRGNASAWDAGSTAAWTASATGAASAFAAGDTVRFDLSGSASPSVALSGSLQPGALAVYSPADYTFSGSGSLAGSMKLLKSGAGALVLPGSHSFTGATTVWDGALRVDGMLSGSPVTVWGGAGGGAAARGRTGGRLSGSGTVAQPVTLRHRGALAPGAGMNAPGTLSLGAGLAALDGSVLAFDLSTDPAAGNDRLAITGPLSLSGTVALVINATGGRLSPGTYTLATYTGALAGSASNLAVLVPDGTPYAVSLASGTLALTVPVTRAPAPVSWAGGQNANTWDLAATANWRRSGSPDVFVAGDAATLDDSGASNSSITLAANTPVAGLAVTGAGNYVLNGAGSLSGTGGLAKSGPGTLTLNTSHAFTGPVSVTGGVLAVNNLADAGTPSSIGASTAAASNLVLDGGALRLVGPQTNTNRSLTAGASGATLDIPSGTALQLSGSVTGPGSLAKTGSGTLVLAAANTHSGGTVLESGLLALASDTANASAISTGGLTLRGGTLRLYDNNESSNTHSWPISVPAGASARLEADGRSTFASALTGSGVLDLHLNFVRTDLTGNLSAFAGSLSVSTDSDGGDLRLMHSAGLPAALLTLPSGITGYYNVALSANTTVPLGALAGAGRLGGSITTGRTLAWQIGARGADTTFSGQLVDRAGPAALTKVGPGALTLAGAHTYTGPTAVNAGKLVLSGGSLSGTAVTVASGAAFGGRGAVTGSVSLAAGSTLLVNPAAGPLAITGDLALSGAITVSRAPGASLGIGTYPILTYTGALTGTPALSWSDPDYAATFDTSVPGRLSLAVTRGSADLAWTGSASAAWNTTELNFTWNGGPINFQDSDRVRFDDASSVRTVALSGTLAPASVTVDTSAAYTFNGTGALAGSASLLKLGSGTLTLSTAQSFAGGTTLRAGTLVLGAASALGAGPVTLEGGTLATATFAPANPIVVAADSTITGGSGSGTQGIRAISGSGVLTLQATNVFDLEGSLADFTGTIRLAGDGSFRFFSNNGGGASARWDLGSRTLNARNGTAYALGSLAGDSASVLQGSSGTGNNAAVTYTLGGDDRDSVFAGSIRNGNAPASVVKTGSAALALSGANTYTGATSVQSGALYLTGSLSTTPVSVSAGATFGGTGTLGGSLTLAPGARLALGVTASATRGPTVSGASTLTGDITVVPALLGGALAPGTYSLLTYTGTLAGSPTFTWLDTTGAGYTATFNTAAPGEVRVTLSAPLNPLQSWRQTHFSTTSSTGPSADTADPDSDGLPNLLEYALGTAPLYPSSHDNVRITNIAGSLALTFPRARSDIDYRVEASSDLAAWTVIATNPGAVGETVTVSDSVRLSASPRRFLRLRVSY